MRLTRISVRLINRYSLLRARRNARKEYGLAGSTSVTRSFKYETWRVASGKSRPGCHWKSELLSKKRALKFVGASNAARLRLKGPTPTPTASCVTSRNVVLAPAELDRKHPKAAPGKICQRGIRSWTPRKRPGIIAAVEVRLPAKSSPVWAE